MTTRPHHSDLAPILRPPPVAGRARACAAPSAGGPIDRPICRCPCVQVSQGKACGGDSAENLWTISARHQVPAAGKREGDGRPRHGMAWHGRQTDTLRVNRRLITALIRAPIRALSSKHQTFRRPIPPMFRAEISRGDRHGPPDPDPLLVRSVRVLLCTRVRIIVPS